MKILIVMMAIAVMAHAGPHPAQDQSLTIAQREAAAYQAEHDYYLVEAASLEAEIKRTTDEMWTISRKAEQRRATSVFGENKYDVELRKINSRLDSLREQHEDKQRLIKALAKVNRRGEHYVPLMKHYCTLPKTLTLGDQGWVSEMKVVQVVDATSLRATLGNTEVWISGTNTSNLADGNGLTVNMWMVVMPPKTYTTLFGQRTIHHLRIAPLD